jgi:hypothetical protein
MMSGFFWAKPASGTNKLAANADQRTSFASFIAGEMISVLFASAR